MTTAHPNNPTPDRTLAPGVEAFPMEAPHCCTCETRLAVVAFVWFQYRAVSLFIIKIELYVVYTYCTLRWSVKNLRLRTGRVGCLGENIRTCVIRRKQLTLTRSVPVEDASLRGSRWI